MTQRQLPDTLETYLMFFLSKERCQHGYIVKERLFEEQSEVIRKKREALFSKNLRLVSTGTVGSSFQDKAKVGDA